MDEQEDGAVWNGEGCEGCGNDDGPYRLNGRWLCLDCLELEDAEEDGDPGTDVLAIDPAKVDPIHLPRLGGLQ